VTVHIDMVWKVVAYVGATNWKARLSTVERRAAWRYFQTMEAVVLTAHRRDERNMTADTRRSGVDGSVRQDDKLVV